MINVNKKKKEDTKGVIRSLISKKNRQCNDQRKKDKRTNNDLQSITQKTKHRGKRNPQKTGGELRCSKGVGGGGGHFLLHMWHPS